MKRILLIAFLSASYCHVFSQIVVEKRDVNYMLANVTQPVNGGIVYNKCAQFANLAKFHADTNEATKSLFEQAIADLYLASEELQFIPLQTLWTRYSSVTNNIVDMGVLNASFSTINYDENDPQNSGLELVNGQYQEIPGRQAYLQHNKVMVTAFKDAVTCLNNEVVFRFSNDLIFSNNTANPIKTLVGYFRR